jgi:hypothetical protein
MSVNGDFSTAVPSGPIMADVMLPPQKWRPLLFVFAVTFLVPKPPARIFALGEGQ